MKTELDIIADTSHRFDRLGIPYILTGSIAMNYYAEPRMTRDIDNCAGNRRGGCRPLRTEIIA